MVDKRIIHYIEIDAANCHIFQVVEQNLDVDNIFDSRTVVFESEDYYTAVDTMRAIRDGEVKW